MSRNTDWFRRRDFLKSGAAIGSSLALGSNAAVLASGATASEDAADFYDDWEDGEYNSNPRWSIYLDEGNFRASVLSQATPRGGNHVLQIRETTGGGTIGSIDWEQGLSG